MLLEMAVAFMLEVTNYKVDLKVYCKSTVVHQGIKRKKLSQEGFILMSIVNYAYFTSFLIILQYKKINAQEAFLRSPSLFS